jgi:serine protease Do
MKILNLSLLPLILLCLVFSSRTASAKEPSANLQLARQLNQAFVEVAENVSPSVVVITVTPKAGVTTMDEEENSPFENLPREYRRRFFRRQLEEQPTVGQGSGIIIRPDGYILTNGHVVEEAETIDVRLQNGRTFKATVRGVDAQSDLAVIKIAAHDLPVAVLADSTKTRVGEFAIAIGAPFSLDYSVTFGHVSAKGRTDILPGFGPAMMDQDFIQTDANINPGNSGGPLVNIEGEVMGINTLIRGLHTGIGFAIPSNLAREVSDQLISDGKFKRAWLGIGIRAFREDADLRELIKGIEDGVVVSAILTNGPASKSDLKASDVITAVDGKPVSNPQQLRGEVRGKKIGQPITLDVFRPDSSGGAKMVKVQVKPAEWDEPVTVTANTKRSPGEERDTAGLGMSVRTLTHELAAKFGVEMIQGVVVVAVQDGTPAARKGIKPGDILTQMDHKYVANPKQFREAIKNADVKKGVVINLVSGDAARFEVLREEAE